MKIDNLPPNHLSTLKLHDIHLPPNVGKWPPAPGWWILGISCLLLLIWLTKRVLKSYQKNRWRKKLLSEFNQLNAVSENLDDTEFMTQITTHLRQMALTLFPAIDVAHLSGEQWLSFLDQHNSLQNIKPFSQIPGRYLIEFPYKKDKIQLTEQERNSLLDMAQHWAKYNAARQLR